MTKFKGIGFPNLPKFNEKYLLSAIRQVIHKEMQKEYELYPLKNNFVKVSIH